MNNPTWPQTVGFLGLCAALAYAINSMAGCAEKVAEAPDVKIECAKQHGTMGWHNDCQFPSQVTK